MTSALHPFRRLHAKQRKLIRFNRAVAARIAFQAAKVSYPTASQMPAAVEAVISASGGT